MSSSMGLGIRFGVCSVFGNTHTAAKVIAVALALRLKRWSPTSPTKLTIFLVRLVYRKNRSLVSRFSACHTPNALASVITD